MVTLTGCLEDTLSEIIRKLPNGKWRLYSKDMKKNLGTFDSKAAAEKHEREVQYFKHHAEGLMSFRDFCIMEQKR